MNKLADPQLAPSSNPADGAFFMSETGELFASLARISY